MIRTQLYPMLIRNNRLDINEVNNVVEQYLNPVIQLNDKEIKIIENFYNSGSLEVNEFFDDAEFSKRLLMSPNYTWKSDNIKQIIK